MNNDDRPTNKRSQRIRTLLLNAGLFIAIFLVVTTFQSRNMLATGGQAAPELRGITLAGEPYDLGNAISRPALVYFFAPWCTVCAASSTQLRWFQRWSGDSVRSVLIGMDWRDPAELAEYVRRHELDMPVLLGMPSTGADYRIRGYPTYYVIDAEGRVAGRDFGFTTAIGLWLRTRRL